MFLCLENPVAIVKESRRMKIRHIGCGDSEMAESRKSFEIYPIGRKLPWNDTNIPQEKMRDFRGMKVSHEDLFCKSVVGKLPSMTRRGVINS